MPAFLVEANLGDAATRADHVDAVIVFAADAADARAMAQSQFSADSDNSWGNAAATQPAAGADLQNWRMRIRVAAPTGGADIADVTFLGLAAATIDSLGTGLVPLLNALTPIAGSTYGNRATAAAVVAGGTGYTVSDTLTVVGGTGTAATLNVDTVSAGVITAVSVVNRGAYSVTPGNPVAVTGGTGGDDATFNLTIVDNVLEVANVADGLGDHTILAELLPPAAGNPGAVSIPGGVIALTHEGIAAASLDVQMAAGTFVVPGAVTTLQQR